MLSLHFVALLVGDADSLASSGSCSGFSCSPWPGISLVTLTFLFGLFALADGIVNVMSAIGGQEYTRTGGWCCSPARRESSSAR